MLWVSSFKYSRQCLAYILFNNFPLRMTHQSWWTSIWSLCLNQQSYLFHYPDRTRLNTHYRHLLTLPRNVIGEKKRCNATVYRGHWGEVGLLENKFHTQIPQICNSPQKGKKKKKPLHGDYNQKSVMFNLQGDLFLFRILYFPPFHSFMSPWYKLFTSRRWWRWDHKYLRWHFP